MSELQNNKRIMKNTVFLYLRMFIVLGANLLIVKKLLNILGVEDYGTYSVIGGVVATFSSLRALFASSTQRYLNFAMGLNKFDELKRIFSTSITIHLLVCVIFLILVESIGLWLIYNKLVIPPERLYAAHWIFQFSVLSVIVTIMTVPYDALIMAHERMDIFAYTSIIDAVLKLSIVFLLPRFESDKLILYAILLFIVSIIVRSINLFYCKHKFKECKYSFFVDTKLFKKMGSFAGWTFFGNTAFVLSHEGTNILLNMFGGTVTNAARNIAYQVRIAIFSFINNIQIATFPQIIKLYADNQKYKLFDLIYMTSKLSYFILFILCLPLIIYTEPILKIWINTVPEYTVSFVRLILIHILVRVFHGALDCLLQAVGNMKTYQIVDSIILFLTLPVSFFLLKLGLGLEIVFVIMIIVEIIDLNAVLYLSKKLGGLSLVQYFIKVIKPCVITSFAILTIVFLFVSNVGFENYYFMFINIMVCMLISCFFIWVLGLSSDEKHFILRYILKIKNYLRF